MRHHHEKTKEIIRYNYDLGYYARQWKVNVLQLAEAIRNTGTTEIKKLKSYLSKKGQMKVINN